MPKVHGGGRGRGERGGGGGRGEWGGGLETAITTQCHCEVDTRNMRNIAQQNITTERHSYQCIRMYQ